MNENLVLAGADQDLFGHFCRLDGLREGAGAMFDQTIQERLLLLQTNPLMGPVYPLLAPYRRLVILEWDVAVFYRVEGRRNVIHAVLHLLQNPATIRALLLSRLPH